MASPSSSSSEAPQALIEKAVKQSLPELIRALDVARLGSRASEITPQFLVQTLESAIGLGSTDMVIHLVDVEHVPIPQELDHATVASSVSVPLLEALTSRGYDFDRAGRQDTIHRGQSLIDFPRVLKNEAVVRWLVEHGARLDRGQEDYLITPMPAPLLETAAMYASVATFKLLYENQAKLGRRTLHCAIEYAAGIKTDPAAPANSAAYDPSKKFAFDRKRLAEMLPYLVDELRLDVNANDMDVDRRMRWLTERGMPRDPQNLDPTCRPSGHYGTPLCYATYNRGVGVIKWLLSKGADPMCGGDVNLDASLMAKSVKSDEILKLFEDWDKGQKGE